MAKDLNVQNKDPCATDSEQYKAKKISINHYYWAEEELTCPLALCLTYRTCAQFMPFHEKEMKQFNNSSFSYLSLQDKFEKSSWSHVGFSPPFQGHPFNDQCALYKDEGFI